MNIKKKAFTLSEALVTLAILGVLAAILIPVLDNVRPDKDKIMYKKAMYAMQGAVSSAMDEISSVATNTSAYWADTGVKNKKDFCTEVANALNLVGGHKCATNSWEDAENKAWGKTKADPDFITTDGVYWWGLAKYQFGPPGDDTNPNNDPNAANSSVHDIYVTRKDQYDPNTKELKQGYQPLRIQVRYDGKVGVGQKIPTADYTYSVENEYLEDSMNLQQTKKMTDI